MLFTGIAIGPGGFHFSTLGETIRTLLGSCVSITLWHPDHHIGGMCHFLLPSRHAAMSSAERVLDGRYADEALEMFLLEMQRTGTHPQDYEAKIFGGGSQFSISETASAIPIPEQNVAAGLGLLAHHEIRVVAQHVGQTGSRYVLFDPSTGGAWMRHTPAGPGQVEV